MKDTDKDINTEFYLGLEGVYNSLTNNNIEIISGDLNAKIRRVLTFKLTIGKESSHESLITIEKD